MGVSDVSAVVVLSGELQCSIWIECQPHWSMIFRWGSSVQSTEACKGASKYLCTSVPMSATANAELQGIRIGTSGLLLYRIRSCGYTAGEVLLTVSMPQQRHTIVSAIVSTTLCLPSVWYTVYIRTYS